MYADGARPLQAYENRMQPKEKDGDMSPATEEKKD